MGGMNSTHPSIPTNPLARKILWRGTSRGSRYTLLFLFGAGRSSVDLLFELLKSRVLCWPCDCLLLRGRGRSFPWHLLLLVTILLYYYSTILLVVLLLIQFNDFVGWHYYLTSKVDWATKSTD